MLWINTSLIRYSAKTFISMETKFNFNSAICTSRSQSERLLSLGLKKETADCALLPLTDKVTSILVKPSTKDIVNTIPAWSLHRLICMMPFRVGKYDHLGVIVNKEDIEIIDLEEGTVDLAWEKDNVYDNIHDCIEWLIKEGYFNKEYLV